MAQNDLTNLLREFFGELPPAERAKISSNLLAVILLRAFGRLWEVLPPEDRQEIIAKASDPTGVAAVLKTKFPPEKISAEMDRARREVLSEYVERLP